MLFSGILIIGWLSNCDNVLRSIFKLDEEIQSQVYVEFGQVCEFSNTIIVSGPQIDSGIEKRAIGLGSTVILFVIESIQPSILDTINVIS